MKTLTLLASLSIFPATLFASDLLYEQTFNKVTPDLKFDLGASLSGNGLGVSGLTGDLCYWPDPAKIYTDTPGPYVNCSTKESSNGEKELSFTLWYKPRDEQMQDSSLFNAFGFYVLWDKNHWTLRVEAKKDPKDEKEGPYWFYAPTKAELPWSSKDQWLFFAGTWNQRKDEVKFYQGTAAKKTVLALQQERKDVKSTGMRDLAKERVIIGNSGPSAVRPFNGLIDNVRFYKTVLTEKQIETIRQADLKNETPVLEK